MNMHKNIASEKLQPTRKGGNKSGRCSRGWVRLHFTEPGGEGGPPGPPACLPTDLLPPPQGVGILTHPSPKFYPLPYKRPKIFRGPAGPRPTLPPRQPPSGGGSAFWLKIEKLCLGTQAPPPPGLTFR